MENIKQNFSIKDLESLSGVKAHTIRMWEKRYGILNPDRTESNIRTYDIKGLQKILNVTFLNDHGYKISRISKLSDDEIASYVQNISVSKSDTNRAVKSMKLAMLNFDQSLFLRTYDELTTTYTFREIYNNAFIPLLKEIGFLWQIGTISPAHEQFVSTLVKQKLYINIEKLQHEKPQKEDKVFVLFLPDEEVHDIGLFYINYELLLYGYKVIFLGQSLPKKDLHLFTSVYSKTVFISYFTVKPDDIEKYINEIKDYMSPEKSEYWILGRKTQEITENQIELPPNFKVFGDISEMTLNL
ncbi:MAG: MerR family transcriptional regulator [Psychroflexus sp.]